jgi:hypothetical protein
VNWKTAGLFALFTVLGACVGAYLAIQFGTRFLSQGYAAAAIADTDIYITALRHLRAGEYDKGIASLESQLDATIIALAYPDEVTTHGVKTAMSRALSKARDYRSEFPRETDDQQRDEIVQRALATAAAPETISLGEPR